MYTMIVSKKRQKREPRPTEFGRIVRAKREADNLTLREAAEQIGIEAGTLSDLENGHRPPEFETVIKVHEGLGLPVDDLVRAVAHDKGLRMRERTDQELANVLVDRAGAFPDLQKVLKRLPVANPEMYRSFLRLLDVFDQESRQDGEGQP